MEKYITQTELDRIAELSKLSIEDTQGAELMQDIENMIKFAEKISLAELSVPQKETNHLFLLSELREDSVSPSLPRENVISQAPTHTDSYITVPTVREE